MTQSTTALMLTALLASALLFLATPAVGQEWSPAQKEVWKTVETMWELYAKGDVEGELTHADDELSLWLQDAPIPVDKSSYRKWATYGSKVEQTVIYELKPVAILVYPEVALVNYYISGVWKAALSDKGEFGTTRITDVYRRKGGKWLWIGGHNTDVPRR